MKHFFRSVVLCSWVLALPACGGGRAGARSAENVASSGAEAARVRAALDVLAREVGHRVDVTVDAALTDGNPGAGVQLAELLEDIARLVARTNPASPGACGKNCSVGEALAIAAGANAMWGRVQRLELRYDPSAGRSGSARPPTFEPSQGRLTAPLPPDAPLNRVDSGAMQRSVFGATLAPRFGDPATVPPGELPAFVLMLTLHADIALAARHAFPLIQVYPRLTDPALTVARDNLVLAGRAVDDTWAPQLGSPALEQAWAGWYRAYASTLPEDRLRSAASIVFGRERGDLVGLPAFPYAIGLLAQQASGRGTPESAVLACADADQCYGPLWGYLVERRRPERRQALAEALLAARSPAFVTFVASRFFVQRDADKAELLRLLERDPEAWSAAFAPALLTLNGVHEPALLDTWTRAPTLRAALLRGIAAVALIAPSAPRRMTFDETPLGHASRAFNALAQVCATPTLRRDFETLATAHIPKENPVWKSRLARTSNGRACPSSF